MLREDNGKNSLFNLGSQPSCRAFMLKLKKILPALVVAALIFGIVGGGFVYAEDASTIAQTPRSLTPEKFMLDGKEYTKEQLIEDFINIAFSEKDWPTIKKGNSAPSFRLTFEKFAHPEKISPTFSEYLYRHKGMPNREGLYKWNRKHVGVGFNWPVYPSDSACGNHCSFGWPYRKGDPDLYDNANRDINKHINAVIPELEKVTGLDMRLQMEKDDVEKTEDYARIRIIYTLQNLQKNFFKMQRFEKGVRGPEYSPFRELPINESDLLGAVSYTTDVRSQVDGYLLPEAANSLGMAVCEIMPFVGIDMMKALLTECLLRALGLPDIAKNNNRASLANWNTEYDAYSKLEELDGRKKAIKDDTRFPCNDCLENEPIPYGGKFPKVDKDLKPFMALSDYDKMMAKILYCTELKIGMGKEQVRDVLTRDNMCFSK